MQLRLGVDKLAGTCRTGDTLSTAAQMMWDHDCGAVPIVDGQGQPIAMLTDRDICMAAQFTGQSLVGIESMNDLVRAAAEKRGRNGVRADMVEATLAAICRPRAKETDARVSAP